MILTERGWLTCDQVRPGDYTIGYNPATNKNEWNRITHVARHPDAKLVRMSNSRWSARVTPNHRWLVVPRAEETQGVMMLPDDAPCPHCTWPEGVRRRGKSKDGGLRIHLAKKHGIKSQFRKIPAGFGAPRFVETQNLRGRDNLMLSAPAETGSRYPALTERDAEILGWIAGDGHVERRKHRPTMSIAQSKPKMVEYLKVLLDGVPHTVYVDEQPTRLGRKACGPRFQFRLDYDYAQTLIELVGHPKKDAVEIVLGMSTAQRNAWLLGMELTEGTRCGDKTTVYQNHGAVLDAVVIAMYLRGNRPRVLKGKVGHETWADSAQVSPNIPRANVGMLTIEDDGVEDVWCVTTELGSWTARDGDDVFLTGNSNAAGTPSKGLMQTQMNPAATTVGTAPSVAPAA